LQKRDAEGASKRLYGLRGEACESSDYRGSGQARARGEIVGEGPSKLERIKVHCWLMHAFILRISLNGLRIRSGARRTGIGNLLEIV
jgi:hypothetical protein